MPFPRLLRLHWIVFGLLCLTGSRLAAAPVLYICGDSTAAPMRPPIQGWGEQIGTFCDAARIKIQNRALGGRSARTFLTEGRWESVRRQLQPGDFVILQFGHNDSKSEISRARYDLSGIGPETEEITAEHGEKIQLHTYGYYLRLMVDQALAAHAQVMILSSVPRNKWLQGKIVRGEENHALWARQIAAERKVPFVDANAIIADYYDRIPPDRLKSLYFPQDNTHTNPAGARINAAAVVSGIADQKLPLAAYIPPEAAEAAARLLKATPAP